MWFLSNVVIDNVLRVWVTNPTAPPCGESYKLLLKETKVSVTSKHLREQSE